MCYVISIYITYDRGIRPACQGKWFKTAIIVTLISLVLRAVTLTTLPAYATVRSVSPPFMAEDRRARKCRIRMHVRATCIETLKNYTGPAEVHVASGAPSTAESGGSPGRSGRRRTLTS
jgi:hypothetical protein